MALQSSIIVEVEKNGKNYVFSMPYGVPLQDCYDASVEVTKEIVEFSKKMEEQGKAQEVEKKEEEVKSFDDSDSNSDHQATD